MHNWMVSSTEGFTEHNTRYIIINVVSLLYAHTHESHTHTKGFYPHWLTVPEFTMHHYYSTTDIVNIWWVCSNNHLLIHSVLWLSSQSWHTILTHLSTEYSFMLGLYRHRIYIIRFDKPSTNQINCRCWTKPCNNYTHNVHVFPYYK